jgi:putative transposase
MPYNPELDQRRSIRLKGYDYSLAGAYFINLVTQDRLCLFGEIVNGEMRLSQLGNTVQREWLRLERRFPGVELDEYVIMPNHLHGIIVIKEQDIPTSRGAAKNRQEENPGTAPLRPDAGTHPSLDDEHKIPGESKRCGVTGIPVAAGSLAAIVRGFKSAVAFRYHIMANNNVDLWQRNYYEHIIRDEDDLDRIRRYIAGNPMNWLKDAEHHSA